MFIMAYNDLGSSLTGNYFPPKLRFFFLALPPPPGDASKTFRYNLLSCEPIIFNQSKYFVRNGTTLKQCR
jgi:hypothetical protein